VSTTLAMKQLQLYQLVYISKGTLSKNHYMSVNRNPAENKKKLPVSKIFSFIASAVDTGF
jgi:hypothetical protein